MGRDAPGKDDVVFRQFANATVIDSCTDVYSWQYGIRILYFQNASDSVRIPAQKSGQKKKAQFGE